MALIKTPAEIKLIREGGKILSFVLDETIKKAKVGANIRDLDLFAEKLIIKNGGVPSFKGYQTHKSDPPFPSTICISINEEVVHGDGTRSIILKSGDVVDFDIGMRYPAKGGLYTDMAKTVAIGEVSLQLQKLIDVTRKSLYAGISKMKPGNHIKDISMAIQNYVESNGFSVVTELVGHGVGHEVHEDPMVPNYVEGRWGRIELKEGMVLALEPMVNVGGPEVETGDDGWSVSTVDKSISAHFEHTIAVTKNGCSVLTER